MALMILNRYFLFYYLLFVGHTVAAQTNWEWLNPEPSGNPSRDLYFLDYQHGFLINYDQIVRTQDSGDTWHIVAKVLGGRKINFTDSTGYVVTDFGTVYKSTDLGETWTGIYNIDAERLNSVSLIGQDTVLITSDNLLLISYDAGASWMTRQVELKFPYVANIEDAFFISASVGHAACTNGIIIKTNDGGQNWYVTEDSRHTPSDFFDIMFVNKNIGFASQEHQELYQTTDGGENWIELGRTYDAAYAIHFLNENVGFFAGDHGAIQKTTDGGKTWEWIGFNERILYNDLYAIHFVDENLGFAAGARGRVVKTVDGGQNWKEYSMTYQDIRDVQLVDSVFFALGESIYRSNDGGQQWVDIAPDMPEEYSENIDHYKIGHFFSRSEGIVIASGQELNGGGVLLKTEDGGQSWRELDASSRPRLATTLFFLDNEIGFISCRSGTHLDGLYKTTDRGETWEGISNFFGFSQLLFINEQKGFGLRDGNLYQTSDGGYTWEVFYEDYGGILNQISFVNDSVGYIVADYARFLKTVNAGDTWEWEQIATEYVHLRTVTFMNESVGFISTNLKYFYRTLDGGRSWVKVRVPHNPNEMTIDSNGTLFTGGDYGALLKATLPLRHLVEINPLSVLQTSDTSATLNAYIRSSLDATKVWVEYGTEAELYTQRFALNLFQGYTDTTVIFDIEQLQPATRYYCRLSIDHRGSTIVSPELSFTTKQSPLRLTLINAETDHKVQILSNEDTVQIDQLALESFSIEALGSSPDSIHFLLKGPIVWETTDYTMPFTLFGDSATDYYGKAPVAGDYLLTAISYVTVQDSSTVLTNQLDIRFTMNVDVLDSIASEEPENALDSTISEESGIENLVTGLDTIVDNSMNYVYPNAFHNELFIITNQSASSVRFYLYPLLGNIIYTIENHQIDAEKNGLRITLDHIPSGTYLLQMISPRAVNTFRIIKRK